MLKSVLFLKSIGWCRRIVSKNDIRFDPARLSGLQNMQAPITGSQMQHFVCTMNWVGTEIPDFSSIIIPLQNFLERICRHVEKRSK